MPLSDNKIHHFRQKQFERMMVCFVVGCGLPRNIVDHPFFQQLMHFLDQRYKIASRYSLKISLLSNYAASLKDYMMRKLSECKSCIRISFDGWSQANKMGLYAIILSLSDGTKFLYQTCKVGSQSANTNFIYEILKDCAATINMNMVVGVCSDSAVICVAGRNKFVEEYEGLDQSVVTFIL